MEDARKKFDVEEREGVNERERTMMHESLQSWRVKDRYGIEGIEDRSNRLWGSEISILFHLRKDHLSYSGKVG